MAARGGGGGDGRIVCWQRVVGGERPGVGTRCMLLRRTVSFSVRMM